MEMIEIKAFLKSPDSQQRLKAITALREYNTEIAVPLLKTRMQDSEFLVRSFVAMGLGKQRNSESFAALLKLAYSDRDPNVRSEAANSLSLFGQEAVPNLVEIFQQDPHWLVRRSILAAFFDLNCPQEFLTICLTGLEGEDPTVREVCIDGLALLAHTEEQQAALSKLITLVEDNSWQMRARLARVLAKFSEPEAKAAFQRLKEDEDHRVVAAALESLL